MKKHIKGIFPLLFIMSSLVAQSALTQPAVTIKLQNPSFEDVPRIGTDIHIGPKKWFDCGSPTETAPDIHSGIGETFFEVEAKAAHGKTYLGMVVRDNETWEAISQRLRTPLLKGQCYNFSIQLARSPKYISLSRITNDSVNYKRAAVLRIWGGNGLCGKLEMLDETGLVENAEWLTYNLRLEPSRNFSYIMLEVFYKTPSIFGGYSGNMLLDNASDIVPVPCEKAPEPPIENPQTDVAVNVKPPVKSTPNKQNPSKPDVVKTKPDNNTTGQPAKKKKEYVKELDEDLVIGQEITLKKLYFDADSSTLTEKYFPIINDVYDFLRENKKVVIEIGGHTNSRCEEEFCNGLSTARAESVANYLISKGIMAHRVKYKGYGKANPKYPNNTPTNRRRNQRVEIKILSKNG